MDGPYRWMRATEATARFTYPAWLLRRWGNAALISCLHVGRGTHRRYIFEELWAIRMAQLAYDMSEPTVKLIRETAERCGFPAWWRRPGGFEAPPLDIDPGTPEYGEWMARTNPYLPAEAAP